MNSGRQSGGMPDIESYGIVGNMETTALISTHGAVDFMCFPSADSPTIFAALLHRDDGGAFSIAPSSAGAKTKQIYLPETNILLTRFMCRDAVCEILDFMPISHDGEANLQSNSNCLIRIVRAVSGESVMNLRCAPRFNYAQAEHEISKPTNNCIEFRPKYPSAAIFLDATVPLSIEGRDARATFRLAQGESAWFVFGRGSEPRRGQIPCDRALEETSNYWRNWSSKSTYRGRYREVVMRSALALKLLISRRHGSIIAAPTFGLPESTTGTRRWDYRYTWIRDAAFSIYALLRLGYTGEAREFMSWIGDRADQSEGDGSFNVMYAIDGSQPPGESVIHTLHGDGDEPPVVGNEARDQLQLDVYGALLDAIYLYNKYGEATPFDGWKNIIRTVDFVCANWHKADQGIWEFRNGERPLLHSRLMCWVTVDRALRLAEKRSLPAPYSKWIETRDEIHEDIFENFWDEDIQSFVQSPKSKTLDASLLMMPLVRFIGPTDPRWLSTLDAIGRELVVDPLVFRYPRSASDGLAGDEGGFSACSFWYAEALARAGRVEDGRLIFEKMLSFANHLGLFSEEVSLSGLSLGNFPQALTHLTLISAAFQLDRSLDGNPAPWS